MSASASSNVEQQGTTGSESPIRSAFLSVTALFEKSVSAIPLNADERDHLAQQFDWQLEQLKDALDAASIGFLFFACFAIYDKCMIRPRYFYKCCVAV